MFIDDFLFVYWYLIRFTGESPFSHSALDIKTYAMAMLKTPYLFDPSLKPEYNPYHFYPSSHGAAFQGD